MNNHLATNTLFDTKIIIYGHKKIFIENYDKILKVDENCIILKFQNNFLHIKGEKLVIESYDGYDLTAIGKIRKVAFLDSLLEESEI